MHRLDSSDFPHVASLAQDLRDQGMAQAVLAGTRPGIVVTDDATAPTATLIAAPEGGFAWIYLAGNPDRRSFREELNAWLFEEHGLGDEVVFAFFACDDRAWETALAEVLAPRVVIPDRRLHYECSEPPTAPPTGVPESYAIVPVDQAFLDSDTPVREEITKWMSANFGSREGFLEHGLGSVALHENRIVAWSLADSLVNGLCDIGIETDEEHRRRGLGAAVTRRTIDLAFERGATRVGWHCHAINVPSRRTAERAGFEFRYEYSVYPVQFDPEKHVQLVPIIAGELVEAGNAALERGEASEADRLFGLLLGFATDLEADVLHSAARAAAGSGAVDRAYELLDAAVDRGWRSATHTEGRTEFESLREDPRWETLLERM